MRSLIVYYSFSGNTGKVADALAGVLQGKGAVAASRLVPSQETRNFFRQCIEARFGMKAKLGEDLPYDISGYDMLCLGTPVWAFAPVPAINTYLDRLSGAAGKKALIFTTYGSGAGVGACVNVMKRRLERKGITEVRVCTIQQNDVTDSSLVQEKLHNAGI
jgi:flavodoxin